MFRLYNKTTLNNDTAKNLKKRKSYTCNNNNDPNKIMTL